MTSLTNLKNLVLFIKSVITPAEISQLIDLLQDKTKPGQALELLEESAPAAPIAAPAGLDSILQEMEDAYSEKKFPTLTPDEARRVRDSYPGFIERCGAFQGRHLVKMLREKIK